MGEAKQNLPEKIKRRFEIQALGASWRDAHKRGSPYHPVSHEGVDFRTGAIIRDLQLKLCKVDLAFRQQQLDSGQVSEAQLMKEGIELVTRQ